MTAPTKQRRRANNVSLLPYDVSWHDAIVTWNFLAASLANTTVIGQSLIMLT
jgi:hypothetical protein